MSFDKVKGTAFCERCGHSWYSSKLSDGLKSSFVEPKSCANCKRKGWNTPRVYAIGEISGTMAKRFKPTGRAAAKIKRINENVKKNELFDKELYSPWNIERAAKKFRFTIEDFKRLPNYEQHRMLLEIYYDEMLPQTYAK